MADRSPGKTLESPHSPSRNGGLPSAPRSWSPRRLCANASADPGVGLYQPIIKNANKFPQPVVSSVDVPFSWHTDLRGVNHSNPSRSARTRKSSRMYATAATATTSWLRGCVGPPGSTLLRAPMGPAGSVYGLMQRTPQRRLTRRAKPY